MLRTQLPTRAAAFAAAALLSTIAACGDAPSAPAAAPAASVERNAGGAASNGQTVIARARIGLSESQLIAGTSMRFGDSVFVSDNSALDLDKTVGVYAVKLPEAASYKASAQTMPLEYGLITVGAKTATATKKTVDFGFYQVGVRPTLRVWFYSRAKTPATGATITAAVSHLTYATDGGQNDNMLDGSKALDGLITLRLTPGLNTVCEQTAPAGYLLADPACQSVNVTWGDQAEMVFFHDTGIVAPPAPSAGS
jgi:hypothetical protein